MVRSQCKFEAIQLVRTLPVIRSAWVECRFGRARKLRSFRTCFCEVRDGAMLLYPSSIETDPEEVVQNIPVQAIDLVPLREATISANQKKLLITIRKPDKSSTLDVRFPEEAIYTEWSALLLESPGLRHVTLADFEIERHVGKGASGRVYLVRDRRTNERLALKVIEKYSVYESEDSYRHALDERLVLELAADHPFILNMKYAFQNKERLFLVTEYCGGGDLFEYLNKKTKPMNEHEAKFLVAEILLAIEHIHNLGVVYRDLKLENVLLDEKGHVRVADFGLSKVLQRTDRPMELTQTFCGTREYVAPEMLSGKPYGSSVDLWAFGILLYEILCGRTPFYSRQRGEIYARIENAQVFYPKEMSKDVQDLLKGLLNRDVTQRLGTRGLEEIKSHPWFSDVDWESLCESRSTDTSLGEEVRSMMRSRSGDRSPQSSKKTKRQIAQEKAMEALERDVEADSSAVNDASPAELHNKIALELSGQSEFEDWQLPGKVVPIARTRKRTPIIAGYSFRGAPPQTQNGREKDIYGRRKPFIRQGHSSDETADNMFARSSSEPFDNAASGFIAKVESNQDAYTPDSVSQVGLDDLVDVNVASQVLSPSAVLRSKHDQRMKERRGGDANQGSDDDS